MQLVYGMCLIGHVLGVIVCSAAAALNAYQGEWVLAAAFLFFVLFGAVGAYMNYRSLKVPSQENATEEER